MKVKVTWRCNNPFAPIERMSIISEAELEDTISFKEIKEFADTATPEGYFLKKITTPTEVVEYDRKGEVIPQVLKYDIIQLHKLDNTDLALIAFSLDIDTAEMKKQDLINKILYKQSKA